MIDLFNKTKITNLSIFSYDKDNIKTQINCVDFNFDRFEYIVSQKPLKLVFSIKNKEFILNGRSIKISKDRYLFKFNSYFESYNFHKTIINNILIKNKIRSLSSFSLSKLNYFNLQNKIASKKNRYFYIETSKTNQTKRKNILIGSSKPIINIRKIIQSTLKKNESVLISGGKGSGKKLLSKILIEESEIKNACFINISTEQINFEKCYEMESSLLVFENLQNLKKSNLFNLISLSKYKKIICLSEEDSGNHLFDTQITMPSILSIKNDIPFLFKFFLNFHFNQCCKKSFFIENELIENISTFKWQNIDQINYFSYLIVSSFNNKIINSTHFEEIYNLYLKECALEENKKKKYSTT